jgi:hypothetical protein
MKSLVKEIFQKSELLEKEMSKKQNNHKLKKINFFNFIPLSLIKNFILIFVSFLLNCLFNIFIFQNNRYFGVFCTLLSFLWFSFIVSFIS